jgi:hypothetical protein
MPDLPNLVTVDPSVQASVCGNGVGVLGSGTGATCSGSQQSSTGSGDGSGLVEVSVASATIRVQGLSAPDRTVCA